MRMRNARPQYVGKPERDARICGTLRRICSIVLNGLIHMRITKDFELRLERLKVSLKVFDDQAVASALGMAKGAFLTRKTRGVWPENEVRLLAQRYPELNIDVNWVSTGESSEAWKAMFTASQGAAAKSVAPSTGRDAAEALSQEDDAPVADLTDDEKRLISLFRCCDDESKAWLLQISESVAVKEEHASIQKDPIQKDE